MLVLFICSWRLPFPGSRWQILAAEFCSIHFFKLNLLSLSYYHTTGIPFPSSKITSFLILSWPKTTKTETELYFGGYCHSPQWYKIIQAFLAVFSPSGIFSMIFSALVTTLNHKVPLSSTHQSHKKLSEQCRWSAGCSSSWSCFFPNLRA